MNWNIVLYIGLAFYVLMFITFLVYQMHSRKLDIELFKQQQLTKSFEKARNEHFLKMIEKGKNANTNKGN